MAGELSDRFYQQYGHHLRRQTEERLQQQGGTDEVLEQYYHEQYGGGSGESQKSNNDGESGKSDKSDNEQSGNSHSEQELKDRAESLEIGKFKNLEDRYSAETSDGKYDISALVKNIDDVWDNGATPIYEPYISDANGKEIVVTEDEFESLEECEWAAMDLYEQMLNGELPSGEDSEDTHISDDERVISLENELGVRFTDPWDDGEEMFTEPIDGLWSLDVLRKTDGTFMASVISDRSGKSWNDKRTFDNSDDAMVAAMELYKNNEDMFKKMKKKWEDYDAKRS